MKSKNKRRVLGTPGQRSGDQYTARTRLCGYIHALPRIRSDKGRMKPARTNLWLTNGSVTPHIVFSPALSKLVIDLNDISNGRLELRFQGMLAGMKRMRAVFCKSQPKGLEVTWLRFLVGVR